MPTQPTDAKQSATPTKKQIQEINSYGLTFRGIVMSIGDSKEWKDFQTQKVLGLQQVVGVTDKKKQYTFTMKAEMGSALLALEFMQEITILNATVMSDKGQHRISGEVAQ